MAETQAGFLVFVAIATVLVYLGDRDSSPQPRIREIALWSAAQALGLAAVLLFALRDIATVKWFEDDALITFQYSRNIVNGCGWNFNCGGDDFATSSYLHTAIGALWFAVADGDRAFALEKIWETALVTTGAVTILLAARSVQVHRSIALAGIATLLLTQNPFIYLFSGMENALAFATIGLATFLWRQERYTATGAMVGVAALVRPEYAALGLVLGGVDFLVSRTDLDASAWLIRWVRSGAAALVTFLTLLIPVWIANGTPFADTLEIKRLTAPNWGAFYQEELWGFTTDYGFLGVALLALGLASLLIQQSPLLVLPGIGIAVSLTYWALELPRSPWYYLPFFLGLTSSLFGLSVLVRIAGDRSRRRPPAILSGPLVTLTAVAVVIVMVGNPIDAGRDNVDLATRITAKRTALNRSTGEWLEMTTQPDERVAVPNIGYIGFYSERFIVDLVGLVTPDAAERKDPDAFFDIYQPEYTLNRLRFSSSLVRDDRYGFVTVRGDSRYRDERFLVMRRADLIRPGSSARFISGRAAPITVDSSGAYWADVDQWALTGGAPKRKLSTHVWAAADRACSLDSAIAELVDRNGVSHVLRAAYALELTDTTHELTFIEPTDEIVDFDWASISRVGVHCGTDAVVSEVGVLAARGAER
jgi:arabinofuranosyltransferase